MAAYAGNDFYLTIGGTDVSAYWTTANYEPMGEEQDITRGSGTDWRQRALGLKDSTFSATLSYDAATVPDYIQKLQPGIYTVEFGPEGNTSGKPRHVQSMLITSSPFEVSVEKTHVTFQVEMSGADAPTTDIMAGGEYS